jgi:hypothetical protein
MRHHAAWVPAFAGTTTWARCEHMRPFLPLAILISLATAASAQSEPEPVWRSSALTLVPAGYVAGEAWRTDEAAMTGLLAVYPAQADDPKSPGSVFAPRQMLVVKLASKDGATIALSAEIRPRDEPTRGNRGTTMTDPDGDEAGFATQHAGLAAQRAALPPGTEPCDLGAWSADKDPRGLNVRAEASVQARVLGTLPPPYRLKTGGSENVPDSGWLTEFRIIGFKDGWFLIEGAEAARQAIRRREKISAKCPEALRRTRLGRGRQGRRQLRQRGYPDGRAVPGAACRREVDAGATQTRRPARHRRRTERHPRLQRTLGSGREP